MEEKERENEIPNTRSDQDHLQESQTQGAQKRKKLRDTRERVKWSWKKKHLKNSLMSGKHEHQHREKLWIM